MTLLFYLVLMEVTHVFQLVDGLVSGIQDGGTHVWYLWQGWLEA